MTRFIIALALGALSTTASANNSIMIVDAVPTAHVSYRDLDLGSAGDRAKFVDRIRLAAGGLCNTTNIEPLQVMLDRHECFRGAVASGVTQMAAIAPVIARR
jgi:UrcA family protein